MPLEIECFICGRDNYAVLLHDPAKDLTAAIDAPDADAISARLAARNWKLDHIFVTHRHADHTAGNLALKQATGCTITGPAKEAGEIPGIDRTVGGGATFLFGDFAVRVIDTPGHTEGHVSYWLPRERLAFTADTLFAMGCGRLPDATAVPTMWASLQRLTALPPETAVYCGHEYTETNARFALTVDPGNAELQRRYTAVQALRAAGRSTMPTNIGLEMRTNPFLRADTPELRRAAGIPNALAVEVFAEIRRRKDGFR